MKTDQYLSLCLDQATKSPLHYRHGCIIVRGGKVIGQGYNDYRPGFNGGALKHGRIAGSALDGPAMAELKEKLKKQKGKKQQQSHQAEPSKSFVPFEGTGGGHHANTPLSMHSEMMAIHSALAASSTMACTATSYEKPCFKLPRTDKRKARLRRAVLAAYVKEVARYKGWNDEEVREEKERCGVFHGERGGEKHHRQKGKDGKGKEKKNQKNGEHMDQYQYGRYGRQTQHGQQQPSASKRGSSNVIRGYDSTSKLNTNYAGNASGLASQHGKYKKDYKRSGKMKTIETPQPEPLLLPTGHAGASSHSISGRKKHPRLNGADLYVARLGWCRESAVKPKRAKSAIRPPDHHAAVSNEDDQELLESDRTLTPTSSTPSTSSSSGSLHDELLNPYPASSTPEPSTFAAPLDTANVRASRPCYRCISYMHSVGIKRVFWTNDAGEWEGGKVRDLVDMMDGCMESVNDGRGREGGPGGPTGSGVFVTKHEVLMLRRMMGDS